MMSTTVAVTGANGLVGSNLIRLLLSKGYTVKALVHHHSNALKGLNVEIIKGDILDKEVLTRLFTNTDIVFHAAAIISIGEYSYQTVYKANVEGTQTVFLTAKKLGVKTFVHFSSIHALRPPEAGMPCTENCRLAVDSMYSYEKTKALAQEWLQQQKGNGMKIVILNPTAIVGPHDYKPSFMGELLGNVLRKKLPAIVNGGYNWVDVRDVADAALNAAEKGIDGDNYLVSGYWLSLPDLIGLMEKIIGSKLKPPVIPFWLARVGVPFLKLWSKITGSRPLYTRESLQILRNSSKNIVPEKARKVLGYTARPTEQTLRDTLEWMHDINF